ncbi:disabled homolog 2-like, partial [Salminus brasiliensis]|uniref:disabled homolog 2-like n=1 Tax=Salminus brasiliensis TaxID=930266 RepID=UPI003B836311
FQPEDVLLREFGDVIDANQNHIKGNLFVSCPSVPCNTPNDTPLSSSFDLFPTPSPDPFSDDPFAPKDGQVDASLSAILSTDVQSVLMSDQQTSLFDCLLNGIVGNDRLDGDSATDGQSFSKQLVKSMNGSVGFFANNPLLNLSVPPPLPSSLDKIVSMAQTPPLVFNGLSKSELSVFQTPPFCNNETIRPPPPNSKSRRVRRGEKVIALKLSRLLRGCWLSLHKLPHYDNCL